MSGLASTSRWSLAEPMALTIPSPTRAMIVSSVAPPISCWRFARTVTRVLTFNWIPFLATASSELRGLLWPDSRSLWDTRWSGRPAARCGLPDRWPWLPGRRASASWPWRRHQRTDHQRHIAAGHIVGLQGLRRDLPAIQPGGNRHDLALDDRRCVDLAERHPDQVPDRDAALVSTDWIHQRK